MTSDHPHTDRWLQHMKQWCKDDLCSRRKGGLAYYDMDLVLVDTSHVDALAVSSRPQP